MKIDKKKIKEEKNYIKLYKSWDFIQENMHTLDSFSDIFLQESLRPTFKTVYAHRKNHSGKSFGTKKFKKNFEELIYWQYNQSLS